jgi:hypothetical protein
MPSKENMDSQEGYGQVAERLASQLGMPADKIRKWFPPASKPNMPYSNASNCLRLIRAGLYSGLIIVDRLTADFRRNRNNRLNQSFS